MFPVSRASTVEQFFRDWFVPRRLRSARRRTIDTYADVVRIWAQTTGDATLSELNGDDSRLLDFSDALHRRRWRGRQLAPNTIRRYLRHLQTVLDAAGPRPTSGRQRTKTYAGLIAEVPYCQPPAGERWQPLPAAEADLVAWYRWLEQVDQCRLPQVPGVHPAKWWRGLITLACSTSLRIGQLLGLSNTAIDWNCQTLVLSPADSPKSRRSQRLPIHPIALRDLLALRGCDPKRLLPWPHSRSTLYKELHRQQSLAGIAPERRVTFHGIRRRVLTDLAKVAPAAAQQAAGHASFRTTVEHYLGEELLHAAVPQLSFFQSFQHTGATERGG